VHAVKSDAVCGPTSIGDAAFGVITPVTTQSLRRAIGAVTKEFAAEAVGNSLDHQTGDVVLMVSTVQ
jgi:hypothetical protein